LGAVLGKKMNRGGGRSELVGREQEEEESGFRTGKNGNFIRKCEAWCSWA
jgi:hypothetical protein